MMNMMQPKTFIPFRSGHRSSVPRTWDGFVALGLALFLMGCTSHVRFPSASPSRPAMLSGTVHRPKGDGPFPAMVLMHGCSGLRDADFRWASWLNAEGYVALVVDSFSLRGISNICGKYWVLRSSERVWDAFGALAYLRSLPFVDGDRIGVIGWSNGGAAALRASATFLQPRAGGFRAAVAFYPSCRAYPPTGTIPLLLLLGELDDWTPAAPCVDASKRAHREGETVSWMVYPGAYHSFDRDRPAREYLGHHLEYRPEAARDAENRIRAFLAEHLRRVP